MIPITAKFAALGILALCLLAHAFPVAQPARKNLFQPHRMVFVLLLLVHCVALSNCTALAIDM